MVFTVAAGIKFGFGMAFGGLLFAGTLAIVVGLCALIISIIKD